jgi:hypothetical protein
VAQCRPVRDNFDIKLERTLESKGWTGVAASRTFGGSNGSRAGVTGGGKWVQIVAAADPLLQHLLLMAEKKFWSCVGSAEEPRLLR